MTAPSYKIHWAKEALKEPPPIQWVVEGLIGEETLVMFYGEGGSKKTYSALDLLVCLASDKTWLEFPTHKQTCLIVDQESGELRLWRRLHETMRGHQIKSEIPLAYVCMPGFNLMKAADAQHLKILIQKVKATVVLVDAFVDVMPGGDENSTKDTGLIFDNLKTLVHSLHIVMIVIHHANRNGGYRGSSNVKGQVDLMLEVDSKPKSPNIDFASTKTRDSEPVEFSANAHFGEKDFYLTPSGESSGNNLTNQYILDELTKQPRGLLYLEQHTPKHIKPTAIKSALHTLTKRGTVQRSNTTNPAIYEKCLK